MNIFLSSRTLSHMNFNNLFHGRTLQQWNFSILLDNRAMNFRYSVRWQCDELTVNNLLNNRAMNFECSVWWLWMFATSLKYSVLMAKQWTWKFCLNGKAMNLNTLPYSRPMNNKILPFSRPMNNEILLFSRPMKCNEILL